MQGEKKDISPAPKAAKYCPISSSFFLSALACRRGFQLYLENIQAAPGTVLQVKNYGRFLSGRVLEIRGYGLAAVLAGGGFRLNGSQFQPEDLFGGLVLYN